MCGIAGFMQEGFSEDAARTALGRMGHSLRHRGPDDWGLWMDADAGIALAHRRLSIVDLSSAGHQPMLSASRRWVLVYNGEIYNHASLRQELEASGAASAWRGHSDTETLLACIEAWGVETTLQRAVGMFAFALWDRQQRCLILARDRAGEKPLYYGWQGDTFLFGSELKALRAHPSFGAPVDRGALALLLRHNYIPAPYSIHQGILKLPPGTWLQLRAGRREAEPQAYWSLAETAERGMANPFGGSENEALDEVAALLGAAVRGQMVADVPLGSLLSGGIDSSLVTALMQANSSRPVRTFTIGFEEEGYDEAMHARAVATHLGTEHTELRVSANDALALVPQLPSIYDEPFADSSQLPTFLVMKLARQHVTVALSGDAGDELFAGYNRYVFGPRLWQKIRLSPASLRAPLFRIAAARAALLKRPGLAQVGDKMRKLERVFSGGAISGIDDFYVGLVSEWSSPADILVGGELPPNLLDDRARWPSLPDPVSRMMAIDGLTYLPDDILVKVDRASMAVSLETRAPFLDRDVMEFAWRLPLSMKLRDGKGKWILRRLLDRHVPRALVERPKMGFGVPLDQWLRGPLREWAGDLLAEERLRREGYFRPEKISRAWQAHACGKESSGYGLWSVLMFQAWLEHNRETH